MDEFVIYSLLGAVVLMLMVRKLSTAVKLLAFQSLVLTILSFTLAVQTNTKGLYVTGFLTLFIKTLTIPYILHHTIEKINIKRHIEPFVSRQMSMAIAIALIVVSYYVTSQLTLPGSDTDMKEYLPASVAIIFLGSFIMIVHRKAIMQGIGLITIENGLFLLTISMFTGMPLVVELGIMFEMLIMVVIIGILSLRIHSTFQSLDTDHLNRLRG